jgi:hypothetical protein
MRHTTTAIVAAAAVISLGLLAATRAATLAQDAPSGQERFVVFETFGRAA